MFPLSSISPILPIFSTSLILPISLIFPISSIFPLFPISPISPISSIISPAISDIPRLLLT